MTPDPKPLTEETEREIRRIIDESRGPDLRYWGHAAMYATMVSLDEERVALAVERRKVADLSGMLEECWHRLKEYPEVQEKISLCLERNEFWRPRNG